MNDIDKIEIDFNNQIEKDTNKALDKPSSELLQELKSLRKEQRRKELSYVIAKERHNLDIEQIQYDMAYQINILRLKYEKINQDIIQAKADFFDMQVNWQGSKEELVKSINVRMTKITSMEKELETIKEVIEG